jgi:flagellin-specific chaperone FliS
MDVGGRPAQALSEFYASIFAQIMQASQSVSRKKFEHVIYCVRDDRDAWNQVAQDVNLLEQSSFSSAHIAQLGPTASEPDFDSTPSTSWTA